MLHQHKNEGGCQEEVLKQNGFHGLKIMNRILGSNSAMLNDVKR